MNVSSATSSANSIWNLLASRASQNAKSSNTASTSETSYSASTSSTTPTSTSTSTDEAAASDQPPPPPAQFDCQMSTSQFAGMPPMGPPPGAGGDPMASLDSDEDGAVSAEEFGLEGASDDVKALFKGIDSDGSGELSTEELSSFREQMTEALRASEGALPMGPPPMGPPPATASSNASSQDSAEDDESDSSTASATAALAEAATSGAATGIQSFLQQLAARYASLSAEDTVSESRLSLTA